MSNKWNLLKYPSEVLSFNFKAYITSSYDFKDASNLLGNWRETDRHQQSRSEGRTERDWLEKEDAMYYDPGRQ